MNSPPNSPKPLGERLANVANKYKKKSQTNSLRAMLNKARTTGAIREPVNADYQLPRFLMGENVCKTTAAPPRVIKNNRGMFVKNPEYAKWEQKCQRGGKRKTARKSKKSRRVTRRRR
jgi:hypothetical protein